MWSLTDEQAAIVYSDAARIAINAFAGTGKTSTLVAFSQARPRQRLLYLAFNRSVKEEARRRFPEHVTCRTTHSLAFASVGRRYDHKLGEAKAFHARNALKPDLPQGLDLVYGEMALRTVNRFLHSPDLEITPRHVPPEARVRLGQELASTLVEAAKKLWTGMCDPERYDLPMAHDGYLKLYQVEQPLLPYDSILLDEAQDTNPCVFALLRDQQAGLILVGDRYQGIYGFRGACNVLDQLDGAQPFSLTRSFRFGPSIAALANLLLSLFCQERRRLQGLGGPSIVQHELPKGMRAARLFRTNAGLFRTACHLLGKERLHFVGGVQGYRFDQILDVYYLYDRRLEAIRDPLLRSFKSFDELEAYIKAVDDCELKVCVEVVREYSFRIPTLVERLREADDPRPEQAIPITTVHKAKGLEWDHVVLGDDFPDLVNRRGPRSARWPQQTEVLDPEEVHLLYVAVTRARKTLILNAQLQELLDWLQAYQRRRALPQMPRQPLRVGIPLPLISLT